MGNDKQQLLTVKSSSSVNIDVIQKSQFLANVFKASWTHYAMLIRINYLDVGN
jgi:hypothetical protein